MSRNVNFRLTRKEAVAVAYVLASATGVSSVTLVSEHITAGGADALCRGTRKILAALYTGGE